MNTWQLFLVGWFTHSLAFLIGGYWVYSRMSKDESVLTSERLKEDEWQ
jgi:hypothetical protein